MRFQVELLNEFICVELGAQESVDVMVTAYVPRNPQKPQKILLLVPLLLNIIIILLVCLVIQLTDIQAQHFFLRGILLLPRKISILTAVRAALGILFPEVTVADDGSVLY